MKRELRFSKYHGCGNDFLVFDEIKTRITNDRKRSRLAKILTDRHFQVGADGLMFLEDAEGYDCSMRLFEPAGNEADMCGNGIRCIAAYVMDKLGKNEVDILTRDGPKHVVKVGHEYRVDMGKVRTTRADLRQYVTEKGTPSDSMLSFSFKVGRRQLKGAIVNSGEPHIVVRMASIDGIDATSVGDSINTNRKRFPKGVNVNFVQVLGAHSIKIRTYERGVYGETLACGTGATASAAVAIMKHWTRPGKVRVLTRGGPLTIELDALGNARMTGPASKVFDGAVTADV